MIWNSRDSMKTGPKIILRLDFHYVSNDRGCNGSTPRGSRGPSLLWTALMWRFMEKIGGWNKQVRRTKAQKDPPPNSCLNVFIKFVYNFWSINARNFKSGSKYWQLNCAHFNHTILGSFHSTLWRKNSLNTQVSFFRLFFFVYIWF